MITDTLALLGLGFLLGLEHSLDADHLVAVSSLVSQKTKVWKAAITGMMWGLGHTAILLLVGVVILALKIVIPRTIALSLEFVVGIMIVVLGTMVLYKLFKKRHAHEHDSTYQENEGHTHMHAHAHGHSHDSGSFHMHLHEHSHEALSHHSKNPHDHNHQPFIVGIIHGLAGSASLMLLILASIESMWVGIAYITVFGLGTMLSMAVLASLLSLPFVFTSKHFGLWNKRIKFAAGLFSIIFGLFTLYRIAFLERLFF